MKGLLTVYVVLAIGGSIGWVMNIIALIHTNFTPLTGMVVARVIGVFVAPLGAILGFF